MQTMQMHQQVQFVQVLSDGRGDPTPIQGSANAGDFLQALMLGTRRALRDQGRPCVTLTLRELNPYALGGVVALFERAVGFYASLIDVNAYDQPGVEAGKRGAKQVITLADRLGALLDGSPRSAEALAETLEADLINLRALQARGGPWPMGTRSGRFQTLQTSDPNSIREA